MPKKRLIEKVGGRLSRLNTSAEERISIVRAIKLCVDTGSIGVIDACNLFSLSTTAYYKWKQNPNDDDKRKSESRSEKYVKAKPDGQRPARKNKRSLQPEELAIVESHVRDAVEANITITEAHLRLTDQHLAVASLSTYYRVAREIGQPNKKTRKRKQPKLNKLAEAIPRRNNYVVDGPMQVLMWDITEVVSKNKKKRYVFALLDLYSRFCLHADVFDKQGSAEACQFFKDFFKKWDITPNSGLRVHSDNGPAMVSAELITLLTTNYHIIVDTSRPYCSNDNPFIESFFATGKDDEDGLHFELCETLEECRADLNEYVHKYNYVKFHSGINNVTPAVRHFSSEEERKMLDNRQEHLDNLYKKHPERYINGQAARLQPAGPVALNPSLSQVVDLILKEPSVRHHQTYLFRMLKHHVCSIDDIISNPDLQKLIHHEGIKKMISKKARKSSSTEQHVGL